EGVLTTFDVATMDLHRHALVRRPQCASCGWIDRDPARAPEPPRLRHRPKGSGRTQYSVPPRETLERFSQHVSPYLGAVAELTRPSTTAEDGDDVYGSRLNLAMP